MNTLVVCQYNNCGDRFATSFDQICHFENNHLRDLERKTTEELCRLEQDLANCSDEEQRVKLHESLQCFYGGSVRMSLFKKLEPFTPDYIPKRELERKPMTLNFCNYRKRPPPTTTPSMVGSSKRQSVPNKRLNDLGVAESAKPDQIIEERKYRCSVEGCNRSYKNSNGLRSHMRSVHNMPASQRPQSPAVRAVAHPDVHHVSQHHAPVSASAQANPESVDGKPEPKDPQQHQQVYRGSSRMTPNEENILSRVQLTALGENESGSPKKAGKKTPNPSENKYACDMCTRTYKAQSNLRKHQAEQHGKIPSETTRPQRPAYPLGQQPVPGSIASAQQGMTTPPAQKSPAPIGQRLAQSPLSQTHSPRASQIGPSTTVNPGRTYSSPTTHHHQRYESPQPAQYLQQSHQYAGSLGAAQTTTSGSSGIQPGPPPPYDHHHQHQQQELHAAASPYHHQQSSPVTVVLQHGTHVPTDSADAQQQQPRSSLPLQRSFSSQQAYDRYNQQLHHQRRPSGQKVQGSHPYYSQRAVRPPYQDASAQPAYARHNAPIPGQVPHPSACPPTQSHQRAQPNTQSPHQPPQSALAAQPQTNFAQQQPQQQHQHYAQRHILNNFEARTVRRSSQSQSGSTLSAQLAPLNVNATTGVGPQSPVHSTVDGIQITKVSASQYTGPRGNLANRQPTHPGVVGSSIRARFDPNRGMPPTSSYYPAQPGQTARYIQPPYAQRIIRVASNTPSQSYLPTSQHQSGQNE